MKTSDKIWVFTIVLAVIAAFVSPQATTNILLLGIMYFVSDIAKK